MKIEYHFFDSLPKPKQEKIAWLIARYTHGLLGEKPQMLPVKPEEVLAKHIGVTALEVGDFAEIDDFRGYVGATSPIDHNGSSMLEVGTLWVPQQYRGRGIGHDLVQGLTDELVGWGYLPYAFCNPNSLKLFKGVGYEEVPRLQIPEVAFAACSGCHMNPHNGGCCDKQLIFKGSNLWLPQKSLK